MDSAKNATPEELGQILVVDDDAILRTFFAEFLQKKGFKVLQASSGLEALDIYRSENPVAVVTDYSMPKMNGEELIHEIKSVHPNTPILMVTGEASDSTLFSLLRYGRFSALHKPFRSEFLFKALLHVINQPFTEGDAANRQSFRLPSQLDVRINRSIVAQTQNVSTGGLFLKSQTELKNHDQIQITVPRLGNISLGGEVVWSKPVNQTDGNDIAYGVRLHGLSDAALNMIKSYIISEMRRTRAGWFGTDAGEGL